MLETKKKRNFKWLIILAAIFFIIMAIPVAAYFIFEKKYENRIYPGISAGPFDLSGLSPKQAQMILDQRVDKINQDGIRFSYHNEDSVFYPIVSSLETDLVYQNINFKNDALINKAYGIGRSGDFKNRLSQKINSLLYKQKLAADFSINEKEILDFLQDNFSHFETPAEDAKISYIGSNTYYEDDFNIIEEKYGQIIDYSQAINRLAKNLLNFSNQNIELEAKVNYPEIHKKDLLNIKNKIIKVINRLPLALEYEDQSWKLDKKEAAGLLKLKKESKSDIIVGLDYASLKDYLEADIAEKINQEPIAAKFEIKDGKVVEFQTSQDGLKLDLNKSAKEIEYTLIRSTSTKLKLVVNDIKSDITNDTVNNFGIKEIIGTGHSNFSGSPANRRHNIRTGADAVNGILVEPGEEFSLIETLGEINADTGYLPELVIKGNETIPEYGGGLCQIGTTMFRATTASGMPVTQRRNHSYRVSYYEPAGTDATIYDPWPDYRFKNDSPYHILIQSRIEGNDLYFDFWSTEDGRIASSTYPTIYNIVRPAPTKTIETDTLEPGVKKCTESAHAGADAYFDYTVTYPKSNPPEAVKEKLGNEEEVLDEDYIVETRFKSHYIPWQAVCLVGIDPEAQKASSTEEIVD